MKHYRTHTIVSLFRVGSGISESLCINLRSALCVQLFTSSRTRTVNFYFHLSMYSSSLCVACNEKL